MKFRLILVIFCFTFFKNAIWAAPSLVISHPEFDYGSVYFGDQKDNLVLSISNIGDSPASGCTPPQLTGNNPFDFEISFESCRDLDLLPGQFCEVHLKVEPIAVGSRSTTVERNCLQGGTVSTENNGIRALGLEQTEVPDGDFNGPHSPWFQINPDKISFKEGRVELYEANGESRGRIEQILLSINVPGTYYYEFEVKNESLSDAEATILGSYVFIEKGARKLITGVIFSRAISDADKKISFSGPNGNGQGVLSLSNINIHKMDGSEIVVEDGDFDGNHSVWTVNDGNLVSFLNSIVEINTSVSRGEISQSISEVMSLGRKAYYEISFDVENQSISSSSANIFGQYIDIPPLYSGDLKFSVIGGDSNIESKISFAGPYQSTSGEKLSLDSITISRLSDPPLNVENIEKLSSGSMNDHSCSIYKNGGAVCYGNNDYFQLDNNLSGLGNIGDNEFPSDATLISDSSEIVQIVSNRESTCFLNKMGQVKCWGEFPFEPATPKNLELSSVAPLDFGGVVKEIAAGDRFLCGTLTDGTVRCGGKNLFGQLAIGSYSRSGWRSRYYTPVNYRPINNIALVVAPDETVQHLVTGVNHGCILLDSGRVRCWGLNNYGQLGQGHVGNIGDAFPAWFQPLIDLGESVAATQVSAGARHTCALLEHGKVKCWGDNSQGQLGVGYLTVIGDNETPANSPELDFSTAVVKITAGENHNCALLDTGDVKCWGKNDFGQLGLGHTENVGDNELATDVNPVDIGAKAKDIEAYGNHTCALLVNHKVLCWGRNDSGQLGLGHTDTIGDDEHAFFGNPLKTQGPLPKADFEFTPINGNIPLTIAFDGSISMPAHKLGKIVNFFWDFGDGSTANGKNVQHTFVENRSYLVKLSITDERGISSTTTREIHAFDNELITVKISSHKMALNETQAPVIGIRKKSGEKIGGAKAKLISSNSDVLLVNENGTSFTAVGPGIATIRAQYGPNLSIPLLIESISLNSTPIFLKDNDFFAGNAEFILPFGYNTNTFFTIASRYSSHSLSFPRSVQNPDIGVAEILTRLVPGLNSIDFQLKDYSNNTSLNFDIPVRYFDGIGRSLLVGSAVERATIGYDEGFTFPENSFSLTLWVRGREWSHGNVLELPSDNGKAWSFEMIGNDPVFKLQTSTGTFAVSGFSPSDNEWNHIAITYNFTQSVLSLFQNGKLVSQNHLSGIPVVPSRLVNGQIAGGLNNFLMDELAIHDGELSLEEIKNKMFAKGDMGDSRLISYHSFDSTGQVLSDAISPGLKIIRGSSELTEKIDVGSRFSSYVGLSANIGPNHAQELTGKGIKLKFEKGVLRPNSEIKVIVNDPATPTVALSSVDYIGPEITILPFDAIFKGKRWQLELDFARLEHIVWEPGIELLGLKDSGTIYRPFVSDIENSRYSFLIDETIYNDVKFINRKNISLPVVSYFSPLFTAKPNDLNSRFDEFFTTLVRTGNGPFLEAIQGSITGGQIFSFGCVSGDIVPANFYLLNYSPGLSFPLNSPELSLGKNICDMEIRFIFANNTMELRHRFHIDIRN